MKHVKVVTAANLFLFFLKYIACVEPYNFKCPSQGNWKLRAKVKCNSISKYFCLYNNAERKYVEGCEGPDWDRKGSKRIFSGFFTRGKCILNRYQPFSFQTNGSMSDCIYAKSLCSEEGQIVHSDGSSKDDRTCRCDYTKNYSFNKTPKQFCFCTPTEEDCSCSIKSCPVTFTLSADYSCTRNGYQENQKCVDNNHLHGILDGKPQIKVKKNHLRLSETISLMKWRDSTAAHILICFFVVFILVAVGFFFVVLFSKLVFSEKLERSFNNVTQDKENSNSGAKKQKNKYEDMEYHLQKIKNSK